MPSLPSESLPRVDGKRHGEQWAVHLRKTSLDPLTRMLKNPLHPLSVGGRVLPKKGAP